LEIQGHLGSFLTPQDQANMRLVDRTSSEVNSTRPLVIYRIREVRTGISGCGVTVVRRSGPYTLFSDAYSTLPRGVDEMMYRILRDSVRSHPEFNINQVFPFPVDFPSASLWNYLLDSIHMFARSLRFMLINHHLVLYDYFGSADEQEYGLSFTTFQNELASKTDGNYSIIKIHDFVSDPSRLSSDVVEYFIDHETEADQKIFREDFEKWGGIEKLTKLFSLKVINEFRVERITNPPPL
jgi:hypothetical protein